MEDTKLYIVTGASGRTGKVAAQTLLQQGLQVRVVLRNRQHSDYWQTLGAEVAIADYSDPDARVLAFKGAHGAYIVSPPQYHSEQLFEQAQAMADNIAHAAHSVQLDKLVVLSSVGAEQGHATGWIRMNRMLEIKLANSGIAVTFLRAAYFRENWSPMLKQAQDQQSLASFLTPAERELPLIATADIGRIAAEALCEDWQGIRILDLDGPQPYSPNDVAQYASRLLNKEISVAEIPEKDWPAAIAGQGFSAAAIKGFTEMTCGLNSGHIAFKNDARIERRSGQITLQETIAELLQPQ